MLTRQVTVTVNGKKVLIEPGVYGVRDFERIAGLSKTASITLVTPKAAQATAIGGNDSLEIRGDEVFTTIAGA